MRSIDFHCDVLSKLLNHPDKEFQGEGSVGLDVTYERLKQSDALLQTFAVFISPKLGGRIEPILESISLFRTKVLAVEGLHEVRSAADLKHCQDTGKIGALLSLEGVDGLQGHVWLLPLLYELGVRAAGLTWNNANWAADGIMERRGGGLTEAGRQFVQTCNELKIIVDVSHLSERAFWDVLAESDRPVVASHSNARTICNHPRNLTDSQIRAVIESGGMIGVTYVPWFTAEGDGVTIQQLLLHIDHICELGGERHIMLGSDFDGIDSYINGLAHPGDLPALREALLNTYSSAQTEGFLSGNALRYLLQQLPPK
ncbi:dipeptidase [Paenibacillus sp. J5C_2022]|uniref:dipeptidase n=1 Tax=Paenibacillus sp. J5C2022 TaxID=2977129 RepID=UPI0021CF7762|nr:dipeptidase [Paenibacillus sp. J5C2022]MCU6707180.1 dipeptidase [Paenibacillus sp. J5C2022]